MGTMELRGEVLHHVYNAIRKNAGSRNHAGVLVSQARPVAIAETISAAREPL